MNENETERSSLNKRVSHIESEIAGLKVSVGGIKDSLSHQAEMLERISHRLGSERTDWKAIISFISLLIVIGGAVLLPINSRIQNNSRFLEQVNANLVQHREKLGHPGMDLRVTRVEERAEKISEGYKREIEKLDQVLQREMRLLDEAIKGDIDAQDVMLQREMQLNDQIVSQKVEGLEALIREVRDVQKKRTSKFAEPVAE